MTTIPPSLVRVPTFYASNLSLTNINRANLGLLRLQQQISTGRALLSVSDDIVKAAAIGVLDDRLERSDQIMRNLDHAAASLNILDSTLDEAADVAREARSLASEQISLTATPSEREAQATVVDQMLRSLMNIANRQSVAGYVLGGTITTRPPVDSFLGYYRYRGEDNHGLITDLGLASSTPVTLGSTGVTGLSSRVRGTQDLRPQLTGETRLSDLRGARGLGIAPGTLELSINGDARISVNLNNADTVNDVTRRIEAAIRAYENDQGVTVLGAGGVSHSGHAFSVDVSGTNQVQFFDIGTGLTGQDLGLVSIPATVFSATQSSGADLGVVLTWRSPISSLAGVTGPLGPIRITNAGRAQVVDLTGAQTLDDVKNAIEGSNLGVRVLINRAGTGLDILNEVSAGSTHALSISEVSGNGGTAAMLGIRSFALDTRISDFNFGRGVQVLDGIRDPISGGISGSLNTDFTITLGDSPASIITIDLTPADMGTVQGVLDAINNQVQSQLSALGLPPDSLVAGLSENANGITLRQSIAGAGPITVQALNNSPAAEQLGLLFGSYDPASATFTGEDRAKVRVDSLFSNLVDLRDSLRGGDVRGIGLAGEDLERTLASVVETRGMVGGYAQRVSAAQDRETGRSTLDQSARSLLRDVDFSTAASRFSLLQTQLEATLRTTALTQQISLLDFLG